jgi:hypothetical protein
MVRCVLYWELSLTSLSLYRSPSISLSLSLSAARTVPPGGSVHAFFNEDEVKDDESNNLEVIILFNNPNKIPSSDTRINFDTTLIASSKKLTPCAKVEFFNNVVYYEATSKNRNVFLKYKGDGRTDVRVGNSMRRVGLIGAIKGNRHANDILDFSTNVHALETAFIVAS